LIVMTHRGPLAATERLNDLWRNARIGIGTVADAILAGAFVQLLTSSRSVTHLSGAGLAARASLALAGLVLIGLGSGLYMATRFGAGPRDS
jgi:uncharacterized protein